MVFLRPLPLLLAVALSASCDRAPSGPNLLLITLDTTRRDHLGCYGYGAGTSPNLDRLAADSLLYTNAYAVSSWTMPTHASMFTGKFPSAHGANYDPEGPLHLEDGIKGVSGLYRARPIAENENTLAQILTAHGYATGGVAGGPWMKKVFRLNKGFEFYDDENVTALNGRSADDVTRVAREFIDEHEDEPFFLFLNYYDPHSPYFDPQREPGRVRDLQQVRPPSWSPTEQLDVNLALYDAEIARMDRAIGALLDHLKSRGLYENTWIFVLADHGELMGDRMLGEPGLFGHGDSLSQAEIHIPFLVKEPGASARKGEDATLVQQVDILPTVLQRLGIAPPPNIQGRPIGEQHPIVSELYKLPFMDRTSGPKPSDWRHLGNWRVLVDLPNKFGWSSNGTNFLVDLDQDPIERQNRRGSNPALEQELEHRLTTYIAGLPAPGATGQVEQPDAETREELRGLGY